MTLVLSRQDVARLLKMPDLIEAIQGALVEVSRGGTINPNRLRVFVPERQAMLACMPAYLGAEDLFGAKIVMSSSRPVPPGTPRLLSMAIVLADTNGRMLAAISGAQIGPYRTAATSAVATRLLARPDAATAAIIGCGVQGRAELIGLASVRDLRAVRVFDRDPDVARRFATEMEEQARCSIGVAGSADEAAAGADLVTLATTSAEPVISAAAIRPGTHINAVGAHTPRSRELDSDTVAKARVFAESRAIVLAEAGDILIPISEGRIAQTHLLADIGAVAAGQHDGRMSADDVTIFKSTGMAAEDVIAAKLVYDAARAAEIGTTIDF